MEKKNPIVTFYLRMIEMFVSRDVEGERDKRVSRTKSSAIVRVFFCHESTGNSL